MISTRSPIVEQIRRFDRFYEILLRKAVRAEVSEDFSADDLRILGELDWIDGGVSGAWLSRRLDVGQSSTSRALKKLEAYGLVTAGASSTDGRMRAWELTTHGRKFAGDMENEYRKRVVHVLCDVMLAEHEQLAEALRVLERTLQRAWMRAIGPG